jgi:DNA-binding transcriptional regulator GbsR (MarR family)
MSASPAQPTDATATALSPIEAEVIDLFVHLSRMLGLPKSVAEIYGLLFVAPAPLSMDDLIERLHLSKGSASQGLKFLRNLGAVKPVYVAGDRRDHFVAEAELRQLVGGFLKEKLAPHFDEGLARLERIEKRLGELPAKDRAHVAERVKKLRQWEKRGKQFLPLVAKILS